MATKNLVPRESGSGKLGTTSKTWEGVFTDSLSAGSLTASTIISTHDILDHKEIIDQNTIVAAGMNALFIGTVSFSGDIDVAGNLLILDGF